MKKFGLFAYVLAFWVVMLFVMSNVIAPQVTQVAANRGIQLPTPPTMPSVSLPKGCANGPVTPPTVGGNTDKPKPVKYFEGDPVPTEDATVMDWETDFGTQNKVKVTGVRLDKDNGDLVYKVTGSWWHYGDVLVTSDIDLMFVEGYGRRLPNGDLIYRIHSGVIARCVYTDASHCSQITWREHLALQANN